MDVEFWIVAVVPILAAVALCDSITRLSTRLSSRLGIADALWMHVAILILFSAAFFVLLFNIFAASSAFATIRHYVRAEDYWIRMTIETWFFDLDIALILLSIAGAFVLAIKQGRSVLLSILAGMLGNIGTIVWMIRGREEARLFQQNLRR